MDVAPGALLAVWPGGVWRRAGRLQRRLRGRRKGGNPHAAECGRPHDRLRRLLAERGCSAVQGSGEGGRITVKTACRAATAAARQSPKAPDAAPRLASRDCAASTRRCAGALRRAPWSKPPAHNGPRDDRVPGRMTAVLRIARKRGLASRGAASR
jgi:pyruvate/2-oxoglutarate dehydrogenase complex dihydrolipoamide acyltransferase (E2) component